MREGTGFGKNGRLGKMWRNVGPAIPPPPHHVFRALPHPSPPQPGVDPGRSRCQYQKVGVDPPSVDPPPGAPWDRQGVSCGLAGAPPASDDGVDEAAGGRFDEKNEQTVSL